MKKKARRIKLGRRVREWMDIPMEAYGGCVKATLVGSASLLVESHGGVFQCGEESIRFHTGEGILHVEGAQLILMELNGERAVVKGMIKGLQFEK